MPDGAVVCGDTNNGEDLIPPPVSTQAVCGRAVVCGDTNIGENNLYDTFAKKIIFEQLTDVCNCRKKRVLLIAVSLNFRLKKDAILLNNPNYRQYNKRRYIFYIFYFINEETVKR